MEAPAARQEVSETLTAAEVGMRIRLMRTVRRMQQQELAIATGITVAHLCKIEAGRHYPHRTTIKALAEALGVTPDALIRS